MMSRIVKLCIFPLILLCALPACVSVGVPQYEALSQRINPSPSELAPYTWQLTFGDYETEVLAVTVANGTIFANPAEDGLLFDGNSIRVLTKIGSQSKTLRIVDVNDETVASELPTGTIRQVIVDDQLFETIECAPFVSTTQGNRQQVCQGQHTYTTLLTFDAGKLVSIRQTLPFYHQEVRLNQ